MKKLVLAASLVAAFGSAQAGLSLVSDDAFSIDPIVDFGIGNLIPGVVPQDFGWTQVGVNNDVDGATVYLTFLGKEALATNEFFFEGTSLFVNSEVPPQFHDAPANVGLLEFFFLDGGNAQIAPAFAVLGKQGECAELECFIPYQGEGTPYKFDYVLGFNDSGSTDGDFDDLVVGISLTPAIPEPSTYALMAAGLGAIGFVARRRQRKA